MKIWPVSGDQPCHEPNTVLKHILTMPALKQFLDLFSKVLCIIGKERFQVSIYLAIKQILNRNFEM